MTDLDKEILAIHERYPDVSLEDLSHICVRVVKWKKKQDVKQNKSRSISDNEIREASIDYQMSNYPMAIGGSTFEKEVRELNVNRSFIAGAKWVYNKLTSKRDEDC